MMRRTLLVVGLALAISTIAHAGWHVNILQSDGQLNPGSVNVNVPSIVSTVSFPQITFLTAAATPNPILVGDGTSFTSGTFTASYKIYHNPGVGPNLTGFNFVIAAFVQGNATISWTKQVTRNSDGAVIFSKQWSISGAGAGGADGAYGISVSEVLNAPANDITVTETFTLNVAQTGFDTAALMLVEQDWVPEPTSMLALGTGLAGLLALRRRNRN